MTSNRDLSCKYSLHCSICVPLEWGLCSGSCCMISDICRQNLGQGFRSSGILSGRYGVIRIKCKTKSVKQNIPCDCWQNQCGKSANMVHSKDIIMPKNAKFRRIVARRRDEPSVQAKAEGSIQYHFIHVKQP